MTLNHVTQESRVVRVCSLTATLPLGPRLWLRLHTIGRDVGGVTLARLGKKRAGRELDGRIWDEFPVALEAVA